MKMRWIAGLLICLAATLAQAANLYNDIVATVDAALAAGGATKQVFTTETDPTTYVRNTNCFAYGWRNALTCRAVYQNGLAGTAGRQMGPTLIAEAGGDQRFAISANHYHPGVGATVYFLGTDGVVLSRTVSAGQQIAGTDIWVLMLNTALPVQVVPAKIWPSNAAAYLPYSYSLPAVTIKSDNSTAEMGAVIQDVSVVNGSFIAAVATEPQRAAFSENIVSGASGSPLFVVMPDGSTVLLGTWFSSGSGPSLLSSAALINATMTSMAGASRSALTADLSAYELMPDRPSVNLACDVSLHTPGSPVVLTWNVSGATSVTIDQGIGAVAASGDLTVYPLVGTTYTLTATNAGGSTSASLNIEIGALTPNTYFWRGNVSNNIGSISNYATTAGGTTAPTQIVPGDVIQKATTVTNSPTTGTSVASWNTSTLSYYGGTYYGNMSVAFASVVNVTVHGSMLLSTGTISGGTFNGATRVTAGTVAGGAYNGDLRFPITSVTFGPVSSLTVSGRLSLDDGVTWLHPGASLPTANQVLAGVAIGKTGTAGTVSLTSVGTAAGVFARPR